MVACGQDKVWAQHVKDLPGQLKLQTPNSKEAPRPKHQTPNSRAAASSKLEARAAVWRLELGISLVFGAWFLVFRFRDFSGAWCLGFGIWCFVMRFHSTVRPLFRTVGPAKLLFIGDIVGEPGRRAVKQLVPQLRQRHDVDAVIANGENSAGGSGIT